MAVAAETQRHREKIENLCVFVSLWRIFFIPERNRMVLIDWL